MFKSAKIGDKVWSFLYGWETIAAINTGTTYPIRTENSSYDYNGYSIKGTKPLLFWDEIQFEIPTQKLETDTKVIVWNRNKDPRQRHFSYFKNGKIFTYAEGRTSWSAIGKNDTISWDNWKLPSC